LLCDGYPDQGGYIIGFQFVQQTLSVGVDGMNSDMKEGSNFLIRLSLDDQLKHLFFTGCE